MWARRGLLRRTILGVRPPLGSRPVCLWEIVLASDGGATPGHSTLGSGPWRIWCGTSPRNPNHSLSDTKMIGGFSGREAIRCRCWIPRFDPLVSGDGKVHQTFVATRIMDSTAGIPDLGRNCSNGRERRTRRFTLRGIAVSTDPPFRASRNISEQKLARWKTDGPSRKFKAIL